MAPGQIVTVSARPGQDPSRAIAAAAYDQDAHHVQVDYSDPGVSRARFQRAPEQALGTVIPWVRERPGQMAELQAAWIGRDTPAIVEWAEVIDRGQIGWTIIPGSTKAWARMVYVESTPNPLEALWADLAIICRPGESDPEAAWRQRSAELRRVCERLEAAGRASAARALGR